MLSDKSSWRILYAVWFLSLKITWFKLYTSIHPPIYLSIYLPKETIWKNLHETQWVISGNEIIREFSILILFELLLSIIYYDKKNIKTILPYFQDTIGEKNKEQRMQIGMFCYILSMKQGETKYTYWFVKKGNNQKLKKWIINSGYVRPGGQKR